MVTLAAPTAATACPSAPPVGTQVDGPGPPEEYHVGDVGVEDDDVEDDDVEGDGIEDNIGSIAFQRCLPLERLGTALLRLGLVLHLQSSHSCPSYYPSLTCPTMPNYISDGQAVESPPPSPPTQNANDNYFSSPALAW